MINWPAVINFDGDEELVYIASDSEWRRDAESLLYNHSGDDQLIDSSGRIYKLVHNKDGTIQTDDTGNMIDLDEFVKLVRIHASNSHRCCIEKINFRDIADGIMLIASMSDND